MPLILATTRPNTILNSTDTQITGLSETLATAALMAFISRHGAARHETQGPHVIEPCSAYPHLKSTASVSTFYPTYPQILRSRNSVAERRPGRKGESYKLVTAYRSQSPERTSELGLVNRPVC